MDQQTDVTAADYPEIFLSPQCACDDRTWCSEEQGACEECGRHETRFVNEDQVASLRKQLDEAREREAQMAAALLKMVTLFGNRDGEDDALAPRHRQHPEVAEAMAALSQEPPASHAPVLRDADTAPAPAISGGDMVSVPKVMTAAMINAWSGGTTFTTDEKAARASSWQKAWLAALAAADRSAAAPAPDMVNVPREPTEAMIMAGHAAITRPRMHVGNRMADKAQDVYRVYLAMVAAAPAPPCGLHDDDCCCHGEAECRYAAPAPQQGG